MNLLRWISLLIIIYPLASPAQNVRRLEEEQQLDAVRRQRVEELIEQRKTEKERLRRAPITEEEMKAKNLVEVEPNNILPSDLSSVYAIVPYSVRRNRWGFEFGLSYSQYQPENYESSFASGTLATFDDIYSTPELPLIELYFNYKFNFSLGSLGAEVGYGMYSNDVYDTSFGDDLKLSLQIVRVGLRYVMDNLFYEPIVAPYGGAGIYTVLYKETAAANTFTGNTEIAPYFYGGVLLQLNWLDKASAVESYVEAGIENTYIFLEARQYMASSAAADPDFSSSMTLSGGISLEF